MLSFKNQLLRIKMRTIEFENVLFIIIWKMIQFTLENQKLKIVEFHKAFFLKDIKFLERMAMELITGQIWIYRLILTFIQEFIESTTVIILHENSVNLIRFKYMLLSSLLMIISFFQEWCSIWNRSHLILLKQKSILRSNWKEENQIKSLISTLRMTEKFFLLPLFGMMILMMVAKRPIPSITF